VFSRRIFAVVTMGVQVGAHPKPVKSETASRPRHPQRPGSRESLAWYAPTNPIQQSAAEPNGSEPIAVNARPMGIRWIVDASARPPGRIGLEAVRSREMGGQCPIQFN
jgi:hypothetical protein